ncbi:hypothetical protein [Umezawaea sp. Da 62-37]|uniref:hypothetical protein n=1 Tax=Umezawaea sp. Da 62-37 TaxID=3075927 RepID=UPI0028F6DA8B|nr:hypothetical protein [Umezawaea sp. Da 62-37]WNV82385.1 hypothetical protein RM788_29775 [Umezawaea sp. Da 62-37]
MGKVKKKCCRSKPRCKKCPVVALFKARDEARAKALKKLAKQERKKSGKKKDGKAA